MFILKYDTNVYASEETYLYIIRKQTLYEH